MAKKYSVSSQFALTIDLKDIFNYKKRFIELKQDVHIFIWVKWQAHKMITNYNLYVTLLLFRELTLDSLWCALLHDGGGMTGSAAWMPPTASEALHDGCTRTAG